MPFTPQYLPCKYSIKTLFFRIISTKHNYFFYIIISLSSLEVYQSTFKLEID